VVETDIADCFSAIPHEMLIQAIEERICDQPLLKLLRVIARAGAMSDGWGQPEDVETPQGGVGSPVMCSVHLRRLDRAWDGPMGCSRATPTI
jgi:RNA-directed DNA polymerase